MRGLMHEDRLFRRIAIQQCSWRLKRRMTQAEQISLDAGIDVMLQQAVVAFAEHQNHRIREGAESERNIFRFVSRPQQ